VSVPSRAPGNRCAVALADAEIARHIDGKTVKVYFVPGKLVNIVVG
jgi:hypothetical protein